MNQLLHSIWMERLGWALLHSLWEGVVLWMLLSCVLISNRVMSARRKHYLACAALLLFALCPMLTTAWLGRDKNPGMASAATTQSRALPQKKNVASSPSLGGAPPAVQA